MKMALKMALQRNKRLFQRGISKDQFGRFTSSLASIRAAATVKPMVDDAVTALVMRHLILKVYLRLRCTVWVRKFLVTVASAAI